MESNLRKNAEACICCLQASDVTALLTALEHCTAVSLDLSGQFQQSDSRPFTLKLTPAAALHHCLRTIAINSPTRLSDPTDTLSAVNRPSMRQPPLSHRHSSDKGAREIIAPIAIHSLSAEFKLRQPLLSSACFANGVRFLFAHLLYLPRNQYRD